MRIVLDPFLRRFIGAGQLRVTWPDGTTTTYQGSPGPTAAIALRDSATLRHLTFNPALAVGETYMDGGLRPVGCTIYDVLDVLMLNDAGKKALTDRAAAYEQDAGRLEPACLG